MSQSTPYICTACMAILYVLVAWHSWFRLLRFWEPTRGSFWSKYVVLHCKILFTEGLKRIEINLKVSCLRACLHGGGGPHLSCQRDQINMRELGGGGGGVKGRRACGTLSTKLSDFRQSARSGNERECNMWTGGQVTSPTWGCPPPCKQASSPQTDTIYKSPERDLPWNWVTSSDHGRFLIGSNVHNLEHLQMQTWTSHHWAIKTI